MRCLRLFALLCCKVGVLAGCPVERLAPEKVAMGVARLSVRNMGNVVALTSADARCGFASDEVNRTREENGRLGSEGSVTWRVRDCVIDLGGLQEVSGDCNGDTTQASGAIKVTATKTVVGILTGNAASPVVPLKPDAVNIDVTVAFDDYQVRSSTSAAWLTNVDGTVSFTLQPHLGVSDSLDVCAVPTADVTLRELVYSNAKAKVMSGGREFKVEVPQSRVHAQVGRWEGEENSLEGLLTVWDREVDLSTTEDKSGLDPEYNAEKLVSSVACRTDLRQPQTYECPALKPRLVQGASALTVQTFGKLVSLVSKDSACGFASDAVNQHPNLVGEPGMGEGTAEYNISAPCTITFASKTQVDEDCNGVKTYAKGTVTVTGTKRVRGILTGDINTAVVPTTRDAGEITVNAAFSGFSISTSDSSAALIVQSGAMTGTMAPRLAKDASTGACSLPTPVVTFKGLEWQDAELLLQNGANTFRLTAETSALEAQSGAKDGRTNYLAGTMRVDGEVMNVPTDGGNPVLDPDYDANAFATSFACIPHLQIPSDDGDCDMTAKLAEASTRLVVRDFGAVAQLLEADTSCGFSSEAVKSSVVITGQLGKDGAEATYHISQPCTVHLPEKIMLGTDCLGVATYAQGTATVTGTKKVRGIRTGSEDNPIIPTRRDPAEITLAATFGDFSATCTDSPNVLTINNGSISGTLRPRLAKDAESGACSISTPVAEFENLTLGPSTLTLNASGKRFRLEVSSGNVNAINGNKGERTNWLAGSLNVENRTITVPLDPAAPLLNPEFDMGRFTASYACKPHLVIPSTDAECNFKEALGTNTARLLVLATGAVTSMINHDTSCGYENMLVKISPDDVQGEAGEMGEISWSIDQCELGWNPAHAFEHDCNGGDLMVQGTAMIDTSRTVEGERETMLLFIESIVPRDPTSVEIRLEHVVFNEFAAFHTHAETGTAQAIMTIHSGTFSGVVQPVLGERASEPGRYDVSVPVVYGVSRLANLRLQNADITLTSDGMTFNYHIDDSLIQAFNGTYGEDSNWVRGLVTVDGLEVDVPEVPLDPHFDQAHFDSGYLCTEDLRGLVE
jgi:hypothetical protein